MRTIVLINLAVVVGSAFAQDTCMEKSAWIDCVSTQRDAASTACDSADTLPLSIATSILLSCACNGIDINYSCAKTYCSGDTSFQSQLLDSFDNCTSFFSNPAAVPTTEAAMTSISQSSSTAVLRASNSPISTSTTASSASNISPTTGTTPALGTTTSVATSQASSATSTSKAAANLVLASNGGLGRFLAFVAGMAALI